MDEAQISARGSSTPALSMPVDGERRTHQERWRQFAMMALIVLLAAIAHFPGLRGEYIWDDNEWLTDNTRATQNVHEKVGYDIQHWETFSRLWTPGLTPHFFPMVTTSYWIEDKLWGVGAPGPGGTIRVPPVGYHIDNLLLHIGSALILFQILRNLRMPGGVGAAWLAAAIIAIHPVTVESVAWIAERKNTLCGIFFFASAYFCLRWFGLYGEDVPARRRDRALGILFFLAAMLSKTTACFLPPALLVMAWWKRGRISKDDVVKSVPLFVVALVLGGMSVYFEKTVAGTTGPEYEFSQLQRIVIAGNAFWFYIEKLLWPWPVMQIYPRFDIHAHTPIANPLLYIAPAAFAVVVGVLVGFWKWLPRGPLAAILIFAGGLFPTLGFVSFFTMVFSFVADHYQYLAMPAIIVLVVEGGAGCVRRLAGAWARVVAPALGGGALLTLGAMTFVVSGLYSNGETLWWFNAMHNPNNSGVLNQYGVALMGSPNPDYATLVAVLNHAMQVSPDDWRAFHSAAIMYGRVHDANKFAEFRDQALQRMTPGERQAHEMQYEKIAKAIATQPAATTESH